MGYIIIISGKLLKIFICENIFTNGRWIATHISVIWFKIELFGLI